ncbi:LPD25 domain-containing protein [Virgibacillus salexigens]
MKEQEKGMENGKDVFIQAVHDKKDLSELTEVDKAAMEYVIDHKEEEHTEGLYYCVDGDVVVGVDNSTGEAWTEEFDHIVKCKAWLKRYDLDIEQPQIFIESSEAPELETDSMIDFAQGNEMVEQLEEKYQDDNRYYKTRYHIVFPESDNSKMEVVSMDRLDIGDGEFLNPHHQARREGNLTEEQKMMLDDVVYGLLLKNERKDIDEWFKGKSDKRKLQTVDMKMM